MWQKCRDALDEGRFAQMADEMELEERAAEAIDYDDEDDEPRVLPVYVLSNIMEGRAAARSSSRRAR